MKTLWSSSWKTTASSVIVAAFVFIHGSGLSMPSWVTKTLGGLEAVAVVCLGASAKDFNVDGKK